MACSHVVAHLVAVPPEEAQEEAVQPEEHLWAGEDILRYPLTVEGLRDDPDPLLHHRGWLLHPRSLISSIKHRSRSRNT